MSTSAGKAGGTGAGTTPGRERVARDGEDAGGGIRLDLQRGLQPAGVAADRGERVRGGV